MATTITGISITTIGLTIGIGITKRFDSFHRPYLSRHGFVA
jgi:hypothetical protein